MKLTRVTRVKRVGRKWKVVSADNYLAWDPKDLMLARKLLAPYFVEALTKEDKRR